MRIGSYELKNRILLAPMINLFDVYVPITVRD